MSLPHAILTALLEKPSSGLGLTRRFDKSIGYFWSATHQQIYRELAKLEQSGFIRPLPQQPSRGRKREYEVLPAGRAELTDWVGRTEDPRAVRDPCCCGCGQRQWWGRRTSAPSWSAISTCTGISW